MKTGKSPGVDGVGIELIKEAGEKCAETVLKILNKCWREGTVPEEWGRTEIVPIYKKRGDSGDCSNYRGIALLNHITKLYERMIERRLRERVEPLLGEEQHGYRKGRGTTDLIFCLRQVLEKSWEFDLGVDIVFIDLQKAFDSIPRTCLWRCLRNDFGIAGRLLRAVKSLYEACECTVHTEHRNEKWFTVKTGVKQGSVLSPLLFIAYIEKVIQNFKIE